MPDSISTPHSALLFANGPGNPMLKVFGLTLIERTIAVLNRSGVTDFQVIAGERSSEISALLQRSRHSRHLTTTVVERASQTTEPEEDFFAADTHFVFEPGFAQKVSEARQDTSLALLASFQGTENSGGMIIFPSSLHGEVAGVHSIEQLAEVAAKQERLARFYVDHLVAFPLTSEKDRKTAAHRLAHGSRKATDGPVSRVLNRPVSIATSRLLIPLRCSPNSATTLVLLLGFAAAWYAAIPTWGSVVIAGILFQLSSIWDGCDGEIARLTHTSSEFGAWYDTLTDNVRYALLVVASGINLYRDTGSVMFLWVAASFLFSMGLMVFLFMSHLRKTNSPGTNLVVLAAVEREAQSSKKRNMFVRALTGMRVLVKQDVLALLAAIILMLNQPGIVLLGGLASVVGILVVTMPMLIFRRVPDLKGQNS